MTTRYTITVTGRPQALEALRSLIASWLAALSQTTGLQLKLEKSQ